MPYDKFRLENIEMANKYIKTLANIDSIQLKYRDKRLLKGKSIFNRKARRDIDKDIVPATMIDPDFRNTYSIISICEISRRSTPVRFWTTEAMVDAELFAMVIEA